MPGVPPIDSKRNAPSVLAYISSDVPMADRAIIYDALTAIPARARTNVVLFSHGDVYANKASLKQSAFFYKKLQGADLYEDPSGAIALFPQGELERQSQGCGANGCTGVSHAVVSATGYNDVQAETNIPCGSSQLSHKHGQNGFIYEGGISGQGVQVDMGLQINAPGSGKDPGQPTSVQPFVAFAGTPGGFSGNPHFVCDQPTFMEFWPAQSSSSSTVYLTLAMNGTLTDGTTGALTFIYQTDSSTGWSQVCSQCSVKRVTAIAVPPLQDPQTALQTWLGVNNPFSNSPQPTVQWTSVTMGYFSDYGAFQTPNTIPWRCTSAPCYTDDPSNGQVKGLIIVNKYDDANESVGINESGPRLQIH